MFSTSSKTSLFYSINVTTLRSMFKKSNNTFLNQKDKLNHADVIL